MARSLLLTVNSGLISSNWTSDKCWGFGVVGYYYQEKISPGTTKVTWEYYTRYVPEQNWPATWTTARTVVRTKVTAITGTVTDIVGDESDVTGTYRNSSGATNSFLFSGSCTVTHTEDTGAASIQIDFDANTKPTIGTKCGIWIGGWGDGKTSLRPNPVKQPATLDKNQHYTACGNPTSVSASGVITPNGTFTVSWSGATAGTANPINKYRVYYRLSSNKAVPSTGAYTNYKDVSASTTSTSFTVSGATRGYYIVCGVLTLPTVDGYGPKSLATGGSVRINSLPVAPSVSVSPATLPSSGGQVTFTITAGTDSDNQTTSLYYATSTDVNKATKVTSPWKPTIGVNSAKTYYFWTYDGLEYSSTYTSKSVTLNTKPVITVAQSGTTLTSANSISNYSYVIAPTVTVTQSKGTGKTYNYYLSYGTSTSNIGNKTLISTTSSKTLSIADVRIHGMTPTTSGYYYRFSVVCNDGIENSDEASSNIFYITRMPRITGVYNKTGYQNIAGFASGNIATHYFQYLGFSFEYDAGYNRLKFSDAEGAHTIAISGDSSSGLKGYITNNSTVTSATAANLEYRVGYSVSDCYAYKSGITVTKIAQISPSNLKLGIGTYKYFTQTNATFANTVNPNFGADPTNGSSLKDFGLYFTEAPSYLKGKIYIDSSWTDEFPITINKLDDNSISFSIKASDLASNISNKVSNKNTSYSAKMRLTFTNNFGVTSYIEGDFTVDFREPTNINLSSGKLYMSNDLDKNAINKWAYLKQGMGNLLGDFTITSYNTNPNITIQISRDGQAWQNVKTFKISGTGTASPGAPVEYSTSAIVVQEINEILNKEYSVSYQLTVSTDGGSKTFSLYSNIPVRGHFSPILEIKANTYRDGTLNIKYEIIETGAKIENLGLVNKKIILKSENANDFIFIDNSESYFSNTSKEAIFTNYDFGNVESKQAKLGITTSLGTYLIDDDNRVIKFITEKTSDFTLDNVIFNLVPTVSYRKNHLGINVLNPDANPDAIIVIGETSAEDTTRDTIYFQTSSANLCKVVNFLLDGGHWGEI